MKTTYLNSGLLPLLLALILSSCTTQYSAGHDRRMHHPSDRGLYDRDLPNVPNLTSRQISKIKDIRSSERRTVNSLEIEKRRILALLDRNRDPRQPQPRYEERDRRHRDDRDRNRDNVYGLSNRDRQRLERELRNTDKKINKIHRWAEDRIYSVLSPQQRRFLVR